MYVSLHKVTLKSLARREHASLKVGGASKLLFRLFCLYVRVVNKTNKSASCCSSQASVDTSCFQLLKQCVDAY